MALNGVPSVNVSDKDYIRELEKIIVKLVSDNEANKSAISSLQRLGK